MSVDQLVTLVIASAALLTSVASLLELQRQRRNEIRPLLAVVETRDKARGGDATARAVYLVNMGNAAAVNVSVYCTPIERLGGATQAGKQEVVAVHRRFKLLHNYPGEIAENLELFAAYTDVDGRPYCMRFEGRSHRHTYKHKRWPDAWWRTLHHLAGPPLKDARS